MSAGLLSEGEAALLAGLVREEGGPPPPGDVLLGLGLALRAPRLGHVCIDLRTVRRQVALEEAAAVDTVPWPDPGAWRAALAASPLVQASPAGADVPDHPFVLDDWRLYVARLWHDERRVAEALAARAASGRLRIITGGPGTGKTTTVARTVSERLQGRQPDDGPTVALAAPTGKAAARLQEALGAALPRVGAGHASAETLGGVTAATLHRLLGVNPGRLEGRYRHHAGRPLPYPLVVIDEASMVSLSQLARLLDALDADTDLLLVGDPHQLASIEAGSVLDDIVAAPALAACRTQLDVSYRFPAESGVGRLAAAMLAGDADGVLDVARSGAEGVAWLDPDDGGGARGLGSRQAEAVRRARALAGVAEGDAAAALAELQRVRTLCAHRDGPWGVAGWNARVEAALDLAPADVWYVGRPVLVTRNDPALDLMNGDIGVVVRHGEGRRVAFTMRDGGVRLVPPVRLEATETVHAMTIHKAQGSEFDHVDVILPPPGSPLLTRQLLYTAITRARRSIALVATEAALREAVATRAERGSGLADRLR